MCIDPPFAAAIAGGATGDLRHEPIDIGSFGQCVAMGAMTAEYEIILSQQTTDTDGNRFLANTQVKQADNLPFSVKRGNFFLKSANQPHPPQEIDKIF